MERELSSTLAKSGSGWAESPPSPDRRFFWFPARAGGRLGENVGSRACFSTDAYVERVQALESVDVKVTWPCDRGGSPTPKEIEHSRMQSRLAFDRIGNQSESRVVSGSSTVELQTTAGRAHGYRYLFIGCKGNSLCNICIVMNITSIQRPEAHVAGADAEGTAAY